MVAGSISSSINFPLISDGNRRKVTFCQIKSVLSQLEEIMKLGYFNRHSDQSRSKLHGASGQLRHIGSRFLSKRPIRDIYAVIVSPEKSGLVMNASTAITPEPHAQSDEDYSRPTFRSG